MEFDCFPFPVAGGDRSALEVLEETAPEVESWRIFRELSALEVDEGALYRPFSTLSNGERTKCLLALLFLRENRFLLIDEPTNHLDLEGRGAVSRYLRRPASLCQEAHLYIWDEPLNYIDVFSRMQLEELLKISSATVLLVEHDRAFLDAVCTKTVILEPPEEG